MRRGLAGLASIIALGLGLLASSAPAQPPDSLAKGFANPPQSARPRVWWHWMNGNISIDGIDRDLAWMKRVGIAGVQNFDAALATPQVVPNRLTFMTPEWRSAFRHAVQEADDLGLEFTIASSPGWSESGGPWVRPDQGMKKLVWSETSVSSGSGPIRLAAPPSTTGPFQDIPGGGSGDGPPVGQLPSLYRDVAVLAFRTPAAEAAPLTPAITASAPIDAALLSDGDLIRMTRLAFAPGQESWVQFDYGRPETIRSLKIAAEPQGGYIRTSPAGRVEASADGVRFDKVADLPVGTSPQQTLAFAPVTARWFRVVLKPRPMPPGTSAASHGLAELLFSRAARVDRFEDKAGWGVVADLQAVPTPNAAEDAIVERAAVLDLTGKLRPDGTLAWSVPPGQWTVVRLGYSLLGRQNHPASVEGTGLEVDKLSRDDVAAYASTYLGRYQETVGPGLMGRHGVKYLLTDSYEAGPQNWTPGLLAEFRRRRGYDPTPWLPVLVGRVVQSAAASDAFLWDYRRTLADLIAEGHYQTLSDAAHARGMGRYGESHESGRAFIGDGMEVKKSADVPMGAMWYGRSGISYDADIRESASVAHVYGQNLVAAESFTTSTDVFGFTPDKLKPLADRMLSDGLNRFVIHTSVHQPQGQSGPGVTLGIYGQWFTRKETWAEQARPWLDYLSRSSYLLQQGRAVADIAWFYGEDDNITALYSAKLPPVPAGYAYDFVNADIVQHELMVDHGQLTTKSGMRYRVLVLDPSIHRLTVPTLRRLQALVAAGAKVLGARPLEDPSLADDPAEFSRLADAVFGPGRAADVSDLGAALAAAQIAPDLDDHGAGLRYVHRALDGSDIYFLSSADTHSKTVEVSFRTTGRPAEIWRADTGEIAPTSYRTANGRTTVSVTLGSQDAVFVVFRGQGPAAREVPIPLETSLANPQLSWTLDYAGRHQAMDTLASWSDSAEPELRYFSGTGTYRATLQAPADWFGRSGQRLVLDLGRVAGVAQISVNGQPLGIAWKSPFAVDVTAALHAGANTLEVKVTTPWMNRMIGGKQPGATSGAFATYDPFRADSPLQPAGLLGPVWMKRITP